MRELLQRAIEGDESAENELFKYLAVRFRVFARQWIMDRPALDDIVQESCIIVLKKYKTETFTTSFEAWAYGILRNNVRRYFQVLKAQKATSDMDAMEHQPVQGLSQPLDPVMEHQLSQCLKRIIAVNRRYARILNLVHQGYTIDEICDRLKMNRGNLYVTLYRARAMLKACLDKSGDSDHE